MLELPNFSKQYGQAFQGKVCFFSQMQKLSDKVPSPSHLTPVKKFNCHHKESPVGGTEQDVACTMRESPAVFISSINMASNVACLEVL